MNDFIKVTVNLRNDEIAMIERMANEKNISRTEMIRIAIRTSHLILQEQDKGGKLLIEEFSGKLKQVIFK